MKIRSLPKIALSSLLLTACGSASPSKPEIMAQIEALRGLEFTRPVAEITMTAEEFRDKIQDIDDEANARAGAAYTLFGHLNPGVDYAALVRKTLSGQASAAYNWERQEFVVPEGTPASVLAEAYRHELVHALQDQHYSLSKVFKNLKGRGQTDRQFAWRFLTEADAVLCQYWEHHQKGAAPFQQIEDNLVKNPDIAKLPTILSGPGLIMPYARAPKVLEDLVNERGWEAVERIYRHPTPSTEWFLHPEKLRTLKDVPVEIPVSALPFAPRGWTVEHHDVLGEYQLLLLLERHLDPERAALAAAGWQGDRFQVYRASNGRRALAWKVLMDSAKDLEELRKALQDSSLKISAAFHRGSHVRRVIEARGGLFLLAGDPQAVDQLASSL